MNGNVQVHVDAEALAEAIQFETQCSVCYGSGKVTESFVVPNKAGAKRKRHHEVTCAFCNGVGCRLTDFGLRVVELVEKWLYFRGHPTRC